MTNRSRLGSLSDRVSRWAKRAASWGEREARQVSPKPRQRRVFRFEPPLQLDHLAGEVEEIVLDLKELPEPADEHDDHDQSLSTTTSGRGRGAQRCATRARRGRA
jgi:hypothetical protein